MRKLSLTMIFLFLLLSVFALNGETKVQVGIYQNEPKVFVDSTGKAQGVFVDIIEYIAAEEGWVLEYVPGTWEQGLGRLIAGEIDLVMDIAYSQERTEKFSFQKHTVLSNWAQVYVSKGSDIQSMLDLEGKNVAGMKDGISYERLISTVKQFGIECNFVETDGYMEIFQLVENGTADAGVISNLFGIKHERNFDVVKSPIIFNPMELRYATAKGQNTEILEAIDRHLVAMKSDSNSVYHKSINRWIATDIGPRLGIPNWVWWALGCALGIGGLFFLHNLLLHKRVRIMTAELRSNNEQLQGEIAVRKEAEAELTEHKEHLEDMVEERTSELRESEERYRSIFENATMGIFRTSAEGRILTVNPAGADILGYDSVEDMIDTITDLAQQLYAKSEERQVVLKLMQEQGKATLELDFLRKDGSVLDAKLNMWAVLDDDSNLRFLEGFIEDISERKKAEEKIRLYHRVYMASTDGIYVIDMDGNSLEYNPAMVELSGYTNEEYRYIKPTDLLVQEDAQRLNDSVRETGYFSGEIRFQRKDGDVAYVDMSVFPIWHTDGTTRCLAGVGHNVTERKLAQDELEEAYRNLQEAQSRLIQSEKMASLGMLVAGIAHEFNNPISAVQSAGDMLKTGIDKFEVLFDQCADRTNSKALQEHKILTAIRNCQHVSETGAERVASIVQRMKTFARLDEAEIQQSDINQNLKDTIAVFQHELKPEITLRTDLQELPTLKCSPAKLNQLFLHLLKNANQACEDGAEILVSSRSDADAIRIAISDTGRGIPQEDIDRIFDPGFTTRAVGIDVGLGLGLPLCYQIAQEHHGSIEVESQIGSGSTFTVILPLNLENQSDHTS